MPEPILNETKAKLPFREIEPQTITTIELYDVGLSFNAQPIGPMHPFELGKVKCTKGFRLVTMPELVQLACACLENKEYESAKKVVEALRYDDLPGANVISNTGILDSSFVGMFVQDNPEIRDGRIYMDEETLEKRLGLKSDNKRIAFCSDDEKLRFTPHNFRTYDFRARDMFGRIKNETPEEFLKNSGAITAIGGRENLKKIVETCKSCNLTPFLEGGVRLQGEIAVAGLNLWDTCEMIDDTRSKDVTYFMMDINCWGNASAYTFEVKEI